MEHINEQDSIRLKELLRRTGEFIAYFELAETKIMEWRQDLEQRAAAHQQQFQQQLNALQIELGSLQETFTEAGLARFRLATENALKQGKEYMLSMQKTEQQILKQMAENHRELTRMSEKALEKITQHTDLAIARIDTHLSQYDVQHFHRITSETCEQVEKSSLDAIARSKKLLRMFQWRTVAIAFLTTLATAFVLSMYVTDEYPWEIHRVAQNERGAGKMLMNAWPKLTYQERSKILGEQPDFQSKG